MVVVSLHGQSKCPKRTKRRPAESIDHMDITSTIHEHKIENDTSLVSREWSLKECIFVALCWCPKGITRVTIFEIFQSELTATGYPSFTNLYE